MHCIIIHTPIMAHIRVTLWHRY